MNNYYKKNKNILIGKYVVSPLDNKTYCRKNGQFLRHLKANGFNTYQEFFEKVYPSRIKYCMCGKKCNFISKKMEYAKTCGNKTCANAESSKTKQDFSDIQRKQRKEKFQKTMTNKSKDEILSTLEKRKKTNLQKYGVDHPWKSAIVRSKIKETMQKKYGSSNYSSSLISIESKQLLEDKDWLYDQHVVKQKPLYVIGEELNVGDRTVGIYLKKHNIPTHSFQRSQWEHEMEDILSSLNIDFRINVRDVLDSGKELDFFIPSHKIAIELCGLYWHSERSERITKWYHKNKFDECIQKNITLLTIFEDEWIKKDIIISKLKYLLGISDERVFARKTTIIDNISIDERDNFFDTYHIQGSGKGSICLGLRSNNNELVALCLFSKYANAVDCYTLVRYATKKTVVGGFSKILKHFENEYNPKKIITFADNRYSNGKLYDMHGFVMDKQLVPDYMYVVKGRRVHKFNFRHKHLKKKLSNYNENLSERDNCFNHGLYRVWDCGKLRYVKQFS